MVPGWVGVFQVPRHIVRIDIDEPGKAGTHGWQVRYVKPSVFFGDGRNGELGSPSRSLAEARRYLASVYSGPRIPLRATATARRNNPITEAGIRLIERLRRGRTVKEFYVEAMSPARGFTPRRVYVGTERTITPARLELGKAIARQLRAELVAEYLSSRKF